MMRLPFLPAALVLAAVLPSAVSAQPDKHKDPLSYDRHIRGLFERYCWYCHGKKRQKAGLDLSVYQDPGLIIRDPKLWRKVYLQMTGEKMPPDEGRDLPDGDRRLMATFVAVTLNSVNCEDIRDPGPPRVRRLSRVEYNNTVSELLGRPLRPADDLPPDPTGFGFDTIAEALRLSPVRVEQYYTAAERVLREAYPSDRVLIARPGKGVSDEAAARRVIAAFAGRAFRRPVEDADVDRFMAIYRKARARGAGFEAAVRPMLLAALISPRFLVRAEQNRAGEKGAYLVEDHDLASRLSYFLWSGPPDAVLTDLAARGVLNRPDELERQARRMLADPRSRQLAENFVGQWLQLARFERHTPDARKFPQFTPSLRRAMLDEVHLFVADILQRDRSVFDLLHSDRTFLNEELAKVYSIPGVRGPEMRPVKLTNPRRGGLLGMGAILALTSDPTRTNVPRRGNYLMGTFLGAPPPPPPPDVPPLEESRKGDAPQTLRAMLELHRKKPVCAGCHAKIDPLGFALEPYDAIGQWRERDGAYPIDALGEMEGGRVIDGPADLRMVLLERREEFLRTFSESLLIYALGRGLAYTDECVTDDMIEACVKADGRFSALVVALVRSLPFRYRRNPGF